MKASLLVGFFALVMFGFLLVVAANTGLWCDEFNWLQMSQLSARYTFESMRRESGPMGPLDLLLISENAKFLMRLGVNPHAAARFQTILFAVCTALLPFGSKLIRKSEKWIWFFLVAMSSAVCTVALTARPNAGLVFFSACALFIAVDLIRRSSKQRADLGWRFWGLLGLLVVGGLSHPYIALPTVCLIPLAWFSSLSSQNKIKVISLIGLALAVKFVWFIFLRNAPLGYQPLSNSEFLKNIRTASWRQFFDETLHGFAGSGAPLKITLLFFLFGAFLGVRENRKFLFIPILFVLGAAVPLLMNIRHNYFFAPRQTLTALPFWMWGVVSTLSWLTNAKSFAKPLVLGLFCIFGVFVPFRHWISNKPPFFDIPRYKMHRWLDKVASEPNHKVIVLSFCHVGVAHLYASRVQNQNFFEDYAFNRKLRLPKSERLIPWTSNSISCSGLIPENPDDRNLLGQIRNHPSNFFVLAPYNVRIPKSLQGLPCKTEIDEPCRTDAL